MTSALRFKVSVGTLRFTSGVTPAENLAANMLVNPISHILLQTVVGGQRN